MKKIVVGCDHAALQLKNAVIRHLEERGCEVTDVGTYTEDSSAHRDNGYAAAKKVRDGHADAGIVICGTGIGISITANKVKGIRCALCGDLFSAEMTRRHNDANMLAMGARVIDEKLALQIVDTFLDTPFEGGRHERRVRKMMDIENK